MLFRIALAVYAAAAYAAPSGSCSRQSSTSESSAAGPQVPFRFPLSNGFPNISIPSSALSQIEQTARGSLPNTPLPTNITALSYDTFNLIAFNELWEVAFFTSMINNITNDVYPDIDPAIKDSLLEVLRTVQAQEELHALGANAILTSAKHPPTQPCAYIFPTTTLKGAIELASSITDLVLGTLQDALLDVSTDNGGAFLALIGSVIGQEGEQNGFYRVQENKVPSALPFLTRSAGSILYAYLLQNFIVPDSCPGQNAVRIAEGALKVGDSTSVNLQAVDQDLTFAFSNNGTDPSSYSLVYINQQNSPIVLDLGDVEVQGNYTSFQAGFPYMENELNGLTIAVVTSSRGPFMSVDEVAEAVVFGPALIEVD